MAAELAAPGTTARVAGGRCPFMWAQSLYVVTRWALIGHTGSRDCCNQLSLVTRGHVTTVTRSHWSTVLARLLLEDLLAPGELDPLNRSRYLHIYSPRII